MSTSNPLTGKRSVGMMSLVVLAVIFLGVVLLSQILFRGARLDLTDARQYTLNAGTKSILKKIPEPINLYYFFSQKTTGSLPQYQAYATRVRELLEEMSERSDGKLKLTVIDPQPFSEEEDRAVAYGLQQVPFGSGESITFGLAATNSTGEQATVPFFQIEKEGFLEYDIAKMVQSLITVDKQVIGVMSNLPMSGGFDAATQRPNQPWVIYGQLSERFEMRTVEVDAKAIDPEIKLLMLVHPKVASNGPQGPMPGLSDDTLYAIDQFVLKGGRLMVFVDPIATQDTSGADPSNPSMAMFADRSSDLPKLFKAWGISFDASKVVADRRLGVPVQFEQGKEPEKHPAILGLGESEMDHLDIATADLESINMDSAGSFTLDASSKLKLTTLLKSSNDAMLASSEQIKFMRSPGELLKSFTPSKEPLILAANLSGKFSSAFPEKSAELGYVGTSKEDNTVFLVADTDVLTDRVWVSVQAFMNQQVANPFANNGEFIINTVDKLSGDNDLISIRSRGKLKTSFTRVDQMRLDADAALRETEQSLQAELEETERKLTELQQAKSADKQMIISAEQQAELQNFQKRRVEVRKQLRDVRRSLDTQIERLGVWVKFWGTFAAALVVVIFAMLYFRRRNTLRRTSAAKA